ncbi:hypothetical protein GGQ74_001169 [Desulfobaculum xiamenense]|uniref:Uncharacterized protein n=1 Tax=Desulfobaculum xiamenense TaxID=995050 RepID=A0A846QS90_9BACT|nr:hypothetical protein [Desulfobaculum xiamenense]NJB67529.1 hypothetical protein [Desulfobaculum xiamenense]
MEWVYDSASHRLMTFVKTRSGRIMQLTADDLGSLRAMYEAIVRKAVAA